MAAQVQARAAREAPTPEELATLLSARSERSVMSPAGIRRLGTVVIDQAQQASYLLGKLAALVDSDDGGEDGA